MANYHRNIIVAYAPVIAKIQSSQIRKFHKHHIHSRKICFAAQRSTHTLPNRYDVFIIKHKCPDCARYLCTQPRTVTRTTTFWPAAQHKVCVLVCECVPDLLRACCIRATQRPVESRVCVCGAASGANVMDTFNVWRATI